MTARFFIRCSLWLSLVTTWAVPSTGQQVSAEEGATYPTKIDHHYEKFLNTFEAELADMTNTTETPERVAVVRALLPGDFCGTIPSNTITVWGISDPGMGEREGYEQARLRATALLALLKSCRLKAVIEDYLKETSGSSGEDIATRYREYLVLETTFEYFENQLEIVEKDMNEQGEHFVKMAYRPGERHNDAQRSTIEVSLEYMMIEFSREDNYETNDRLAFTVNGSDDDMPPGMGYISRKINDLSDISSMKNGRQVQLPPVRYDYQDGTADTGTIQGELLYFGSWNAYIREVSKKVLLMEDVQDALVKSVSDQYTSSMNALNKQLIRKDDFSFRLQSIHVNQNELSVMLK